MLSREAILSAVLEHFSGLYKCVEFSYAEPNLLFFGAVLLMSELGVQWNEPIGHGLFYCTLIIGSDVRQACLDPPCPCVVHG